MRTISRALGLHPRSCGILGVSIMVDGVACFHTSISGIAYPRFKKMKTSACLFNVTLWIMSISIRSQQLTTLAALKLNRTIRSEILSSKIRLAKPSGLHLPWVALWGDICVMLYRGHSLLFRLLEAVWPTSQLAIRDTIKLCAMSLKRMLLVT